MLVIDGVVIRISLKNEPKPGPEALARFLTSELAQPRKRITKEWVNTIP